MIIAKNLTTDSIPFSFTLTNSGTTSAGVFLLDGTLVKTLWSNLYLTAGTYFRSWDMKDENGNPSIIDSCKIKVLKNNVKYVWEGVIGNTSASMVGETVHRGLSRVFGIASNGKKMFICRDYNEGQASQAYFFNDSPQVKLNVLTNNAENNYQFGQACDFVTSDSNLVYWSGVDPFSDNKSQWFLFATKVTDNSQVLFASGRPYTTAWGTKYKSVICQVVDSSGTITGLAVQKKHNLLFVSHSLLNRIMVYNKTDGRLLKIINITDPKQIAVDTNDNLWIYHEKNTEHFIVINNDIVKDGIILKDNPSTLAITESSNGKEIVVIDGNTQQVKGYDNLNGNITWTLGQLNGYVNNPDVSNDKFYFSDQRDSGKINNAATGLAFLSDGSFWLGDSKNCRLMHFSNSRKFIETIQYLPATRSIAVDQNNSSRVFANYLEFQVDYSKPLKPDNKSWVFKRNWGFKMTTDYDNEYFRLRCVATLPNGRTYCMQPKDSVWQILELSPDGIRFTGISLPNDNTRLDQNGSLRKVTNMQAGKSAIWSQRKLMGFDSENNPKWGKEEIIASSPPALENDPLYRPFVKWNVPATNDITSSNVIVSFEGIGGPPFGSNKYHLGGIKSNKWLWKTATATEKNYQGDYPQDGRFDIGNGVQYPGGPIVISGSNIFWNYHGEFWKGTQTNKWQHVHENGLLLGIFGKTGTDIVAGKPLNQLEAPAEMAGNVLSAAVVKIEDGIYYLYHCDESAHAGIHRWKISGTNTISEQEIMLSNLILPSNLITIRGQQTISGIQLTWIVDTDNDLSSYTIERSSDGVQFNTLFVIKSKEHQFHYTWLDSTPLNGVNIYRLKGRNYSNATVVTKTINVTVIGKKSSFQIYPNPIPGNQIIAQFSNVPKGVYLVKIFTTQGNIIIKKQISHVGGNERYSIQIPPTIPKGHIQAEITGNGLNSNFKLIK